MHLNILPRGIMNKNKWNKWWIGWTVGMILPVFGFLLIYALDKSHYSLSYYIAISYKMQVISKIICISLIADFPGFYFFLNRELYISVRGIILSMLTWGVFLLFINFIIPLL